MSIPKPKLQELDPKFTYDAWVTDIALHFLEERPNDRPFFLVTGWFGPHPPFLIPEPYFSMYDPEDAKMPPNFGPQPDRPRANLTTFYHQLFKDHGEEWQAWKKSVAVYWGYCTLIDDQVGRLLHALEEEDILDDTLVIYISDHGEQLGSQGLWQKMMPYEEGLRVPMILRLPGVIEEGLRSQAIVSLIDIIPTILSVIGEEIPSDMLGRDLSSTFKDGKEFQADPYRFSEHKPLGDWHQAVEWRLVTDNHYKYVWNQADLDELYNLKNDPYELSNLIDQPDSKTVQDRLRDRLRRWMIETDDSLLNDYKREAGLL
jgi:arylsulfatase A-like enzyme